MDFWFMVVMIINAEYYLLSIIHSRLSFVGGNEQKVKKWNGKGRTLWDPKI